MADDKLAGHLDVVSPSLPDLLELLAKHVPKTGTLALRFDEHPEAFDGLTAAQAEPAFLPDGTPMGFHLRGDLIEALARCARCSRAVGVLTCQVTIGASTAQRES